jgi:hypothetical protein
MQQVQVNKYIRLALTIFTGVLGLLAAYNWSEIVDPKTAGLIVVAISAVKAIIDVLAPGAGVATQPVGSSTSLITHKSVS